MASRAGVRVRVRGPALRHRPAARPADGGDRDRPPALRHRAGPARVPAHAPARRLTAVRSSGTASAASSRSASRFPARWSTTTTSSPRRVLRLRRDGGRPAQRVAAHRSACSTARLRTRPSAASRFAMRRERPAKRVARGRAHTARRGDRVAARWRRARRRACRPPGPASRHRRRSNALENYFWLTSRAHLDRSVLCVAADGTRARRTDYEHPLAAFIDRQRPTWRIARYFDAPARALACSQRAPAARRSAVGCRLGGGRIIVAAGADAVRRRASATRCPTTCRQGSGASSVSWRKGARPAGQRPSHCSGLDERAVP